MTFEQVLAWCRANEADVRGIYRGKDIAISHNDNRLPQSLPAIGEIFHWELNVRDLRHAVSASDLERMVAGKLTIDALKATLRSS
jgi:hypothetical protein